MSVFYGKTNSIQKNGSVELNLDYSLTPPTDIDKIWVRSNKANNVIVKNENNVVIGNDKTYTSNDTGQNIKNEGYGYCYYKGYLYTYEYISYNSYYKKYDLEGHLITTSPMNITNRTSNCYKMWIYNDKIYLYVDGKIYILAEDCQSVQQVYVCPFSGVSSSAIAEHNGNLHLIYYSGSGSNIRWYYIKYNYVTNQYTQVEILDMPNTYGSIYRQAAIYNNYMYFCKANGNAGYNTSSNASLIKYNYEQNTCEVVFNYYFQIPNGSLTAAPSGSVLVKLGTKLFITSGWYNWTGDGYSRQYMDHTCIQYDIPTNVKTTFGMSDYVSNQFTLVDEQNSKLILAYGYTNTSWQQYGGPSAYIRKCYNYTFKTVVDNGTLLMTTDGTGKSLELIKTDNMTIEHQIQNLWLGDSNNIGQIVEAYYYSGSAWYGINGQNWNEILDASVSVEHDSLDMNLNDTNTQAYTYTISQVAHNNEPEYTIGAISSDTTTCIATLDNTNQTITIDTTSLMGQANVTLQLVDNYGNKFSKIISVDTLDLDVVYNIVDVTNTELTQSIECQIGDLIVTTVAARDSGNEVISEGWTLLGKQVGNYLNQDLAFYYKIAEATTESVTVTQTSSARIYISMVAFTGKTTATMGTFEQYDGLLSGSITLPENKLCLVSAGSNLWNSSSPYPLYNYQGTTHYIADLFATTIQGRLGTWIDFGGGGERTIVGTSTGENSLIIGYITIE